MYSQDLVRDDEYLRIFRIRRGASRLFLEYAEPVGLQGEENIANSRVLGVIAASSCAGGDLVVLFDATGCRFHNALAQLHRLEYVTQ